MDTLKETEWMTINKVLLELYDITDIDGYANRVLRICRMLIPYSKGYFLIFDENGSIRHEQSAFIEMPLKTYETYIESYYEKDYMKYIMDISNHTITYRDTDIMDESIRHKTEIYREFLRPNDIPYGAGIVLRRSGVDIGIVNFFRNDVLGDFSDKDMFILDMLKDHLSHILYRLFETEKTPLLKTEIGCEKAAIAYSLSDRETEVLKSILAGMSNAQIAEQMSISLSTVKKHVYHIFSKMEVNTRTQLRVLIDQKVL